MRFWGGIEPEPEFADLFRTMLEEKQGRVAFHVDRLAPKGPILDGTSYQAAGTANCVNLGSIWAAAQHGSRVGSPRDAGSFFPRLRYDE